MQDHPQLVAAHRACPAGVILEQEDSSLCVAVVCPMPDVVQSMKRLSLERLEQRTKGRPLEPMQFNRPNFAKVRESAFEIVALAVGVELLMFRGAADDTEQSQRWLHQQGTVRPWQVEVANDRRKGRHGQEVWIVKQIFPGNVDQLGRAAQAQCDPDPPVLAARVGQGAVVDAMDLAME